MRELRGRVALVTGASRGLGRVIAGALAGAGMDLVLAARSRPDLEASARELEARGVRAVVLPTDLAEPAQIRRLAEGAVAELGAVDVLVNNAGILSLSPFDRLEAAELERAVRINLVAPMLLTRLLLPRMLERGRGHVVNISSLAGKVAPPYDEAYAATKAGLIAFTRSLREECRGTGVSASVVCPGFVAHTGMYEEVRRRTGWAAPRLVGTSSPQQVARAVLRAIRRDEPEILVSPVPVRPLLALAELLPSAGRWVFRRLGVPAVFRVAALADPR